MTLLKSVLVSEKQPFPFGFPGFVLGSLVYILQPLILCKTRMSTARLKYKSKCNERKKDHCHDEDCSKVFRTVKNGIMFAFNIFIYRIISDLVRAMLPCTGHCLGLLQSMT